MRTLSEVLKKLILQFSDSGFSFPKREAEDLLCELLNLNRSELYLKAQQSLSQEQEQRLEDWVKRRLKNEPLAYIVGYLAFYHAHFKITPSVLIPRQETELLVDEVVQTIQHDQRKNLILWDLCTGSGCIGLSIKKRLPHLKVVLSDLSEEALAIAKENAFLNRLEVEFLHGDLFGPFHGRRADFIVANPPYISTDEYLQLESSVKEYEPRLALEGGAFGDEFYRRFAQELPNYLNPSGKVWFEIGYAQGATLLKLFSSPNWVKKKVEKDWAQHDRFFFLENE